MICPSNITTMRSETSRISSTLAKNGDAVVTQYTMTTLEELGLLKIDFLGLRNLSVIHDAEEQIRKKKPDFRVETISYEEPKVYAMMSAGHVEGVFQFESSGMRNVVMQLKPERLEDLIALNSAGFPEYRSLSGPQSGGAGQYRTIPGVRPQERGYFG